MRFSTTLQIHSGWAIRAILLAQITRWLEGMLWLAHH